MAKPLENLMNTIIETIMEAIQHEPWFAYINNGVSFTGIAINHKRLYEEIVEVQENPEILIEMEAKAVAKFGKKHNNQVASIIFKHVWGMVVYNTSSIIAIDKQIREHNDHPNKED